MRHRLVLRRPRLQDEAELLRAHAATSLDVPTFLHLYQDGMSMPQYLDALAARERGEHLGVGQVPSTFLFAFVGRRVVGRVSLRHELTPALERVAGHIGYAVVPEFRRRGYATEMLRQALDLARMQLGLSRVLVTCDDDNIGSIRVIEKNGGVLENIIEGTELRAPKRRYWIDTPPAPRRRG
ncbi:GNAT family N-acetyltransferase [Luteitalea sp. TBR-22]|uniref:GNAT family N-acetyltransferase n=1 Tax=Luteitalea sp. TBR-22 TaxID=2802971 RepID=UPI001EF442C0|nr:GNAT family N-acetyltransferase [Luteitalea sp. TBR-22]